MAKTIATIKGTMLAPGISKNNRMYTPSAIGRMVARMKERLNDPNALPVVMRTHHDAGDNSRLIVGRITSVEQQPDGRATYEAKLYDTVAGRDIAALIDPEAPALRTTSVYGYWVGPTSETKQEGKRIEVGEDLAIDALDFTASPGVEQSRIDSVAFESHSMILAAIGKSALDGKSICESYEATIEMDQDPDDDLEIWERSFTAKQRKQMASAGQAMPGGRYPIANKSDLRNAIRAVGRGSGDHSAIRKHIITRARALGLMNMIPSNWNSDGSMKETAFDRAELFEGHVEVCVLDDNGNPIVKVCASNVDSGLIKKAAKQAGKLASRIVDQNDSDAIDFDGDDQADQADVPDDGDNDGFVVKVGSDPVDNSDPQYVGGAGRETYTVVGVRDHVQVYERTWIRTTNTASAAPVEATTTTDEESVMPDETTTAAVEQAAPTGLSEADMAKLATLIGASVKEAMGDALNAVAKAKAKNKKNKPADTSDNGPAESAKAPKAGEVKESSVSAADLDKRLKEERDKTVAELRESLLKEHGLPQRKGFRFGESDTDVAPTGDDLWDKRAEVWAQFFPWGQTQQAAASTTAA